MKDLQTHNYIRDRFAVFCKLIEEMFNLRKPLKRPQVMYSISIFTKYNKKY